MIDKTLLICPSDNVRRAFNQHFSTAPIASDPIRVATWTSVMGHRGDRVIVLPFKSDSQIEREQFDRWRKEYAPTKVAFGGHLIDLNSEPVDVSSGTLREAIQLLENVAVRKEVLASAERGPGAKAAGDKHRDEAAAIRTLIAHVWRK